MKWDGGIVGGVFEIQTSLGLSYAQCTHIHPDCADVLRIFSGFFTVRPSDVLAIVDGEVLYTVLCPVAASLKAKMMERVGNSPVRADLLPFPKFRNGVNDPKSMKVEQWWIWDGKEERLVGPLSEDDQKKYPRLLVRNIASIKSLIQGEDHPSLI